jgi:hypothetical protein
MHRLDQLFQGERLPDARIGERRQRVAETDASGEERDWHVGMPLANRPRDLDPVFVAKVDVQKDDRDVPAAQGGLDRGLVLGLDDSVALQLEVDATEEAHGLVVVGHDDHATILGDHRS